MKPLKAIKKSKKIGIFPQISMSAKNYLVTIQFVYCTALIAAIGMYIVSIAAIDIGLGCFRKCHFGIPRNTEFYTELVLFRVIPRNSAKFLLFNSAEFGGIPCRFVYTEFRISSNENTIIEPITKDF
jgi:hypothetical protein